MNRLRIRVVCTVLLMAAGNRLRAGDGAVVTTWNALALDAIGAAKVSPPEASRLLAMVQLAVWDAVAGLSSNQQPFYVRSPAPAGAPAPAAAISASYHALRLVLPNSAGMLDSHFTVAVAAFPANTDTTNAMRWGRQVALEILRWRDGDGAGVTTRFAVDHRPGYWERTPPSWELPLLPRWGRVRPFAMRSVDDAQPPPPPALNSIAWAADFNEVKRLGATNSTLRTPEQQEIARFWMDGPGTETPPGHWNRIAGQLIRKRGLDLTTSARLLAALNVAMADAGIATWHAKYTFNWWRPITAIRGADTDGNDATQPDSEWRPLIPTPPFPEHVSGHSAYSAAAATVLAGIGGGDEFEFVLTSESLPGVVRRFSRFSDAAAEAGQSRIFGGIHFPSGNREGLALGRRVGELVLRKFALGVSPTH